MGSPWGKNIRPVVPGLAADYPLDRNYPGWIPPGFERIMVPVNPTNRFACIVLDIVDCRIDDIHQYDNGNHDSFCAGQV